MGKIKLVKLIPVVRHITRSPHPHRLLVHGLYVKYAHNMLGVVFISFLITALNVRPKETFGWYDVTYDREDHLQTLQWMNLIVNSINPTDQVW